MRKPLSHLEPYSQELLDLEKEVRAKELIYNSEVQMLLRTAKATFSRNIYDSTTEQLRLILEFYMNEALRKPDKFRPYGPVQLLNQGSLHMLDQMDGVPLKIYPKKLVTGMLILGPQGSGKSKAISLLCKEMSRIKPDVTITIIDPKNGFRNLPDFRHIDLHDVSLDLATPQNVNQENFVYEFMPILSNIASIIYGLEFLNRAVAIVFSQLRKYNRQTNLCLKDIYEALLTIKPNSFKQIGYYDTAKTGLSFILGKQNLFCCRKGLSLEWLFNQNTVLDIQHLTNESQCKVLFTYLLYWLYQRSRNFPETKEIKHLLIIDDATRFVGVSNQLESGKKTSPLGHILAVLRSAGIAVIFATQIPSQIDPAILSLSRNLLVVGNINGESNLRVVQSLMSLTHEQKNAILRFKTREALCFISGADFPYPVHGWVPSVEDFPEHNIKSEDCSNLISPWHSLTELSSKKETTAKPASHKFNSAMDKLVWDCINYPFNKVRAHVKRLGLSVRVYEPAMNSAIQEGFLLRSMAGKSVYLIATKKAFDKFNASCPYKRSTSIEHAFYVNLAAHIIKQNAQIQKVQTEVPIGTNGAAIDVTAINNEGQMKAIEVTLNTSNLLSNAAKLQDTTYEKIIWLCKDAATSNAVKAYFNKNISLPKELKEKFEYIHFSNFMKGKA